MESVNDQVLRLKQLIQEADAIVIGAGAGLSTAAGHAYSGERFQSVFADFEEKYGFHDCYSGGFFPYETPEEFWAFWSRNIMLNRYSGPTNLYCQLLEVLEGKDFFVITTNVDHQFQLAGFPKDRLFYTQGDYGLFQCSKPCCQETFDNEDAVRKMVESQEGTRIPSELLPVCPHCGAPMTTNLRCDDKFVEDEGWHAASLRYSEFLEKVEDARTLYLELGVGYNTPGIIKFPFMQMTYHNENASYVTINMIQPHIPKEIKDRSLGIEANIADVIAVLGQED